MFIKKALAHAKRRPFSLVRKSESMNVEAMKETIQSFIIREQWCRFFTPHFSCHFTRPSRYVQLSETDTLKQFWMADHTNHVAYIIQTHKHLP